MGNNHVFHNRIPAITTACLTTAALALMALSSTSCAMLIVEVKDKDNLLLVEEELELSLSRSSIGVFCEGNFFYDDDPMWRTSRIFTFASLSSGAISSALAWAVATFLPPTACNWRLISVLSSMTAVLQIPVLLLLEAEPCTDFVSNQNCQLGPASYVLIASTVFWVAVTLCTQCMDPPLWALELSAWRLPSKQEGDIVPEVPMGDEEEGDEPMADDREPLRTNMPPKMKAGPPPPTTTKRSWRDRLGFGNRRNMHLNITSTEESDDEYGLLAGNQQRNEEYIDQNLDDRLVLRVLPNGRRQRGDSDAKSARSFENLDDIVQMAEEGRSKRQSKMTMIAPMEEPANDDDLKVRSPNKTRHDLQPSAVSPQDNTDATQKLTPEKPTYIKASAPSQVNESMKIVAEASLPADHSNVPAAFNEDVQDDPISSTAILQDLQASSPVIPVQQLRSAPNPEKRHKKDDAAGNKTSPDKAKRNDRLRSGIRALTSKIRVDTKRRSTATGKNRNAQSGYAFLDDNYSDASSHYSSPPIEVKIDQKSMQKSEQLKLEDDEEENTLVNEWSDLHRAMSTGAFRAVNERANSFDQQAAGPEETKEEVAVLLLAPSGSDASYSDPEPVYYDSEDTRSELSLDFDESEAPPPPPPLPVPLADDSSTLSSKSAQSGSSANRKKRRRSRRRAASPVHSIRSVRSLLDTSIVEETDADIIAETAADHSPRRESHQFYPIKRVASAPDGGNFRGRTFVRRAIDTRNSSKTVAVRSDVSPRSPLKRLLSRRGRSAPRSQPATGDADDDDDGAGSDVSSVSSAPNTLTIARKEEDNSHEALSIPLLLGSPESSSDIGPENMSDTVPGSSSDIGPEDMPDIAPEMPAEPPAIVPVIVPIVAPIIDADTAEGYDGSLEADSPVRRPIETHIFRRIDSPEPDDDPILPIDMQAEILPSSESFDKIWYSPGGPRSPKADERGSRNTQSTLPDRRARSASLPRFATSRQRGSRFISSSKSTRSKSSGNSGSWSTWKEQREFGGGIHARSVSLSDDSSGSSQPSMDRRKFAPVRSARSARIKRLAQGTSVGSASGSTSDASSGDGGGGTARSARLARIGRLRKQPTTRTESPATPTRNNCKKLSSVKYQRMDNDAESFQSDAVEALDLQLIEVRRPIGAEYGNDEASL